MTIPSPCISICVTDPGSDLKDGFLKTYLQVASTRTPIVTYNTV